MSEARRGNHRGRGKDIWSSKAESVKSTGQQRGNRKKLAGKWKEIEGGEGRQRNVMLAEWLVIHHHCWLSGIVCVCVSESICASHSTVMVWQRGRGSWLDRSWEGPSSTAKGWMGCVCVCVCRCVCNCV